MTVRKIAATNLLIDSLLRYKILVVSPSANINTLPDTSLERTTLTSDAVLGSDILPVMMIYKQIFITTKLESLVQSFYFFQYKSTICRWLSSITLIFILNCQEL